MSLIWLATFIISYIQQSIAQTTVNSTDPGYPNNPILDAMPQFSRSLPVQILLTGIVFTLVSVLLIHLIFTAQYHWPLAPVNYILQVSSVLTLLISLIATLKVVLSTALNDSRSWPYMMNYIAVSIPPEVGTSSNTSMGANTTTWSTAEIAAWLTMDATTSALIQITHIQFLTLLYPSRLEARLILCLLGPLAILSAAMQLLPIHQNQRITDIADVIRNTCNATLSLLFTIALFIWGFFVNRKQAWRTDGGTAAFGGGALTLALVSSTLNFVCIPPEFQYNWLPGLMWAVVLWQSFLGWWWWVGGGMGVGEIEELLRREEKRERKNKARLAKRTERREKAQSFWRSASESFHFTQGGSKAPTHEKPAAESIEMSPRPRVIHKTSAQSLPNVSENGHQPPISSLSGPGPFYNRLQHTPLGGFIRKWFFALRKAHLHAAHDQAIERIERRQQAYGTENMVMAGGDYALGWGLGSFGLRERERREGISDPDDEEVLWNRDETEDHCSEPQAPDQPPSHTASKASEALSSKPAPSSMWWWGPLRRWRLQDSTVY